MKQFERGAGLLRQRLKLLTSGGKRHFVLVDTDERPLVPKPLRDFEGMPCPAERGVHERVLCL